MNRLCNKTEKEKSYGAFALPDTVYGFIYALNLQLHHGAG